MKEKIKKQWPSFKELELEKLAHWKKLSTKHKMEFLEEALRFGNYWKK